MSKTDDFYAIDGVLIEYKGMDENVVIPENITAIQESAFWSNPVKNILIPKTVREIEECAFLRCSSLQQIHVAQENPAYAEIDGVLFDKKLKTLICYPRDGKSSYQIPEGVTALEDSSFSGCTGLKEILFPKHFEHLGCFTFEGCTQLECVHIPEGITEISKQCFYECKKLKRITIPDTVTFVSGGAFMQCTSLQEVVLPAGIQELGWRAFADCPKLKKVSCAAKSLKMHSSTFENSNRVYFAAPNMNLNDIQDQNVKIRSILHFCEEYLQKPDSGTQTAVKYIEYIKHQRKKLYNLALKNEALLQLMVLEKLIPKADISDLCAKADKLSIAAKAALFAYQEEILPVSARAKIDENKMEWALTGVLPAAEAKKSWTFELSGAGICITGYKGNDKDIVVPNRIGKNTVTAIGDFAFSPNAGRTLKTVKEVRSNINSICIPEGVKEIGANAFEDCAKLTSVILPDSVTAIGEKAFRKCKKLKEIKLPEQLKIIGTYAFQGCSELKKISFPASLQELGIGTFIACSKLMFIDVSPANKFFSHQDGVLYDKSKSSLIACPAAISHVSDIPFETTEILPSAFENCKNIEELVIPDTVRCIGARAFMGCSGLKKIHLPAALTELPEAVFSGCSILNDVELPETISSIGIHAFRSCRGLTSIRIPGQVSFIQVGVFNNCSGLKDLYLSERVQGFGVYDTDLKHDIVPMNKENPNHPSVGYLLVFSKCNLFTIHAPMGSHAEQFAIENELPFVAE